MYHGFAVVLIVVVEYNMYSLNDVNVCLYENYVSGYNLTLDISVVMYFYYFSSSHSLPRLIKIHSFVYVCFVFVILWIGFYTTT